MGRESENRGSGGGSHRIQRVEREIREVVGSYLISGFKGELHGVVSVSRVIVSKDLRNAKVFVTVMGSEADRKASVTELQEYAADVQHEVNRRLRMKYCPRLTFLYDEGFDNVLKVEKILLDLSRQRKEAEKAAAKGAEKDEVSDENGDDSDE